MLGCCETEREKNLVLLLSSVYVCALLDSSPLTVGVNGNSFLCYNNIVSSWWKLLYFLYPDTHRLCECITEGVCKCKLIGLSHCSWSVTFIFSVWSPWDEAAATASEWNRDGNKFWDKSLWLQKWLSANVRLAWCLVEKVPLCVPSPVNVFSVFYIQQTLNCYSIKFSGLHTDYHSALGLTFLKRDRVQLNGL